MPRSTATKTVNTSTAGKKERSEDDDHAKGEKRFDDKQYALFPSDMEKKAPFHKSILFDWMRTERIPVNHRDNNPKLQFISASAYLQACIKPKDHGTNLFS